MSLYPGNVHAPCEVEMLGVTTPLWQEETTGPIGFESRISAPISSVSGCCECKNDFSPLVPIPGFGAAFDRMAVEHSKGPKNYLFRQLPSVAHNGFRMRQLLERLAKMFLY